jgi:HD-GYP domain-containing protein (c-di-GMP phosphodiesterase class II)
VRRLPGHTAAPALAIAAAGILLPGGLLGFMAHSKVHIGGWIHFAGVGFSAVAATAAAIALTIVGARRNDGRTVLLGTAFTVMASLLALHGLATPGIILPYNGLVGFTGAATLPIGGAVLALSALPSLKRPRNIRRLLTLQAVLVASIAGLGTAGMLDPSLVNGIPKAGDPTALVALGLAVLFYGLLLFRALRTFLLTRRRGDLAVVVGIAWLTAAVPPALLLTYQQLGWWLGHIFELAGIVLVGVPVAADLRRAAQSRPLSGDLTAAELVLEEEAFLGPRVHALTMRLAMKDGSTEEHTRRVALRAVQVGEELGLQPYRLRDLAIGGLLHDIGKLSVPDQILKKPGPLTDEEFALVKRHPELGRRLLGELGGFADSVSRLVSDHHERLEGGGYPRGLEACDLELDTRILTVCDVYDALISPRVYRPAWTHEQALALLREETGSAFDTRCVAALERVLARERAAALAVAV